MRLKSSSALSGVRLTTGWWYSTAFACSSGRRPFSSPSLYMVVCSMIHQSVKSSSSTSPLSCVSIRRISLSTLSSVQSSNPRSVSIAISSNLSMVPLRSVSYVLQKERASSAARTCRALISSSKPSSDDVFFAIRAARSSSNPDPSPNLCLWPAISFKSFIFAADPTRSHTPRGSTQFASSQNSKKSSKSTSSENCLSILTMPLSNSSAV
mmetsp:Transcript_40571/g.98640  ORF Transcript_40571/g.98640 Transcript_40571/m.98640 type:complete len:210 (-) Transcript_40571:2338-2967(-)